jgi:transposase InsO family protein
MSRKGYSPDNAACEGFFGRLKIELFYARNWQGPRWPVKFPHPWPLQIPPPR